MNAFLIIFATLVNSINAIGVIMRLCLIRYNGQDTAVEKLLFLVTAVGNAIAIYLILK